MRVGTDWLDEIRAQRFEWIRVGPASLETMLRPDLPCRIMLESIGENPVLYVAIGTNCTVNYWQWATLDPSSSKPLPRAEALDRLWRFIDLAMITSKSKVRPKLLSA